MVPDYSIAIFVATHKPRSGPLLKSPFYEVFRGPAPSGITRLLQPRSYYRIFAGENLPKNLPLETWSEFGALLAEYPWPKSDVIGLAHYRCFLDLEPEMGIQSSFSEDLSTFLVRQSKALDRLSPDTVYVGAPMSFKVSVWEQFVHCGDLTRNLEPLLILACARLDERLGLTPGYSERSLRTSKELVARNLFIGPTYFAKDWAAVLLDLVGFLAPLKPEDADARWAAFILERLFSVYISTCSAKGALDVIYRPMVYFD